MQMSSDPSELDDSPQGKISLKHSSYAKLLTPFQRKMLQKSLQDNLSEQYRQRIEIMLLADEGKTQTQICKALGCSQGTARHWIFMAQAGLAHNWDDNPIGRPKSVNEQYLERLKELVSQSPKEFGYPFRRWTAQWLSKHLAKELGIEVSDRHINRLLKDMGLSTRPKPTPVEDIAPNANRLAIRDLTETSVSVSPEFWPFNSIR
ncbi:helix-turn-helix domain-containing protein [Planktothrix sp. FACHB-1375]|uniref:Helix-turn-helix domain-containing protein n=3 Tax=Oscillatoriophycideae TaxID=1301283 RepID=A0A926VC03_9CYAN|nr:helix-turn-helix domain-containing protein [Aerosakkonema funiforme FACHB-1375]